VEGAVGNGRNLAISDLNFKNIIRFEIEKKQVNGLKLMEFFVRTEAPPSTHVGTLHQ